MRIYFINMDWTQSNVNVDKRKWKDVVEILIVPDFVFIYISMEILLFHLLKSISTTLLKYDELDTVVQESNLWCIKNKSGNVLQNQRHCHSVCTLFVCGSRTRYRKSTIDYYSLIAFAAERWWIFQL